MDFKVESEYHHMKKEVSMTGILSNQTMQTNSRHREEETMDTNSQLELKGYYREATSSLFPSEMIAQL